MLAAQESADRTELLRIAVAPGRDLRLLDGALSPSPRNVVLEAAPGGPTLEALKQQLPVRVRRFATGHPAR